MKLNIELPDNFKIEDYIDALERAVWDITTVGRYNPWPIVSGPFEEELMNVLIKTFKKVKNTNKNTNYESKTNSDNEDNVNGEMELKAIDDWITDVYDKIADVYDN